jgi:hemerythrin
MRQIAWDPSMTTGVESVDAQHKQLITWLNGLLQAMSEGRGRGEIEDLLGKLGAYAATHFSHEEKCMAEHKCPVAEKNIAAHQDFVRTFTSFRDEFEQTGPTAHLTIRIESELMVWLTTHIMRVDTGLAVCVRAGQ